MSFDEITIPTEILQDVFHLLCDKPIALHDLKNESHYNEFPWAAGQVCRHWRGAFLSHKPLWTSFSLGHGDFRTAQFVEMNRRAALYLERSGQQPLAIFVSMPLSGTQRFPKKIWGMLLSCLKRWKKADLTLGGRAALVLDGLLISREHMSSLESLMISIPDSLALNHHNTFQITPRLTELDLSLPGCVAPWQFPWAQLTKLRLKVLPRELDGNDGNSLWGVLFRLENIEELHISVTTLHHRRPRSRAPPLIIRLPSLRLLEISLVSSMIFSSFAAPLLEHLHIHGYANYDVDFSHDANESYERAITSLIQRSSCQIRRLVLDNCRSQEIRIAMKALASVEELSVNYSTLTLDVIQDVTELDGCICLPRLRVLQVRTRVFSFGKLVKKPVMAISRLLEARGKGLPVPSHDIVPLERFVVWFRTSQGEIPDEILGVMHGWPSFAQIYINGSILERLNPFND